MYPQVFSAAKEVDQAFLIILGFSVFILAAITLVMLYFLWRYHYKRNPEAADIHGSVLLEIIWTALPVIIVMGLFWTGWTSFKAMRNIPEDAMVVAVEGRMWSWRFTYDNGKTSKNLVVPVNTPVKLNLVTKDVIHSFYVPAMRLKWDMVPGMETDVWFQSDALGEYDIFCAEYCGLKHADMLAVLKVVEPEEYQTWLEQDEQSGTDPGLALMEQFGCFDCHSKDLSEDVAPTLLNIGGKERTVVLPGGKEETVVADKKYLEESVLAPDAKLVKGWDNEMPPYKGEVTDEQLDKMVNYMLTGGGPPPGQKLADQLGCLGCHTTTGEEDVGPTFKGLYMAKRTGVDADGKPVTVTVDEQHLKEAIVKPSAFVPKGFEDEMPIYDDLSEDTMNKLMEYLKSLGGEKQ